MRSHILLGAGGHAKSLVEAITAGGGKICAYVDPKVCSWINCRHVRDESQVEPEDGVLAIGLGGISPAKLAARLELLSIMLARGFEAPPVVHPASYVSANASLAPGTVILAGAVVQPGVKLGTGVIINSGAIVEHDSNIGAGSHVAPGAIILGNCKIGTHCFVGAGTVIVQEKIVTNNSLIPALHKFSG
ncbi:MAG: hypothetical protein VX941_02170 [Pseudomonadota bacterium]|nr:hypothetical protein [Pseudomonadota bacterium]